MASTDGSDTLADFMVLDQVVNDEMRLDLF